MNLKKNNIIDSNILYGQKKYFNTLIKLYNENKFPKVLLFSGKKGIGKSTLLIHFLNYVYDKNNYDFELNKINKNSVFYNLFQKNLFENIIYLNGENSIKIESIRNLRIKISKSTIDEKPRFIILDDIDLYNKNSLNALLKILEEPTKNNFFVLINNQSLPLLETIRSRSIEMKFFLKNEVRIKIIDSLINEFHIDSNIDYINNTISPGNFILFNEICYANKITIDKNFIKNIEIILKLYKKNRNNNYINLIYYILDLMFYNVLKENKNISNLSEVKSLTINDINNFVNYNLNQNSIINAISERLSYER